MADSFFGIDTSSSNLNDDEGGGEPSEDEYDALNDETFGQDSEEFDWEYEHEQLAGQLESSRRNAALDDADSRLEASLSQLVLDETDAPRSLGSSVWRHDVPFPTPTTPVQQPALKNVCTVEELERQLRQNQQQTYTQNYFQPRFPPVILQRPPGLQAPLPIPFAPQQSMAHNMNQMNQPLNKMIGQNSQINQIGQSNMMNHMNQNINQIGSNINQMNQNVNQMGQGVNHMGQNVMGQNQMGQNVMGQNQMGHNVNQFMQNSNQMNQFQNNQMAPAMMNQMHNMNLHPMNQNNQMIQNQMGQNMNQMVQNSGSNMNQMNQGGQNMNQMGQNMNQMGQNMNQMGQNMNQMGQNQMIPNGNQFGMNQFQQMMGQPRMMAPPPGMNMPRQNFGNNMNQFNTNFRGQMQSKNDQQISQQNMIMNHNKNQNQIKPNQLSPKQKPVQNLNHIQNMNQAQNNKLQKSRVYNNKSLTSQNLVQLIQNTHPMLNFNNSFHNASHHPILNRNHFNNQLMKHLMFDNRQNGNFGNTTRANTSVDGELDEYAGLMTAREKQWLINIQMLQLNTGTPYIHDFYYTVFLERQASKEKEGVKEAHKANQQNHPFYSGGKQEDSHAMRQRERHNSHRHNSTGEDPRTYVPTQFENSLGKLQCGSVTAPRKIIDVEVVGAEPEQRASRAPSVASNNPAEVPREMRRTKQLLLDIEALYLILLRLEELNDPLAISNALILKEREEKQKQLEAAQKEAEDDDDGNLFLKNIESVQRRPKQESPKSESIDKRQVVNLTTNQKPQPAKNLLDEDKEDLLNKMFSGLLHGERVPQILAVRKGKSLLARFLARTPETHPRLRPLWSRVLRCLPTAARRDEGGALVSLEPHFRRYALAAPGWPAVAETCAALAEALDPARGHHALDTRLTLSCVCALTEKAMMLVGVSESSGGERQWYRFLKTVAKALRHAPSVAPPTRPVAEARLSAHLKRLEARAGLEILQRGATIELSAKDAAEHLVRHLC
ncbi:uncharacterized protein LOC116776445 isoform X2 [Danaus plexippus]|uniref:uncharacterized protein LOC116776445 isoform X2 n=1 Tax=Danaus plexippus TaxID=13037 RepID=UPI002AB0BEE5|nr:uncharacterized protein LOC116776445 isoform X2 [Danaus plexippus]